ncbi:hypothetical protein BOX15_Mlig032627g1, partial [Macrostomum lignano]
ASASKQPRPALHQAPFLHLLDQVKYGRNLPALLCQRPTQTICNLSETELLHGPEFSSMRLPFQVGSSAGSSADGPESSWPIQLLSMAEFSSCLATQKSPHQSTWLYASYIYLHPGASPPDPQLAKIRERIDWSGLGFDRGLAACGSTLWIGGPGSKTNLHYDAYGYNIVFQVFGSKRWTLYPPESSHLLRPTRLPFEESTIFSRLSAPASVPEARPHSVTLEPGDLLYVPRHWWHRVESLGDSASCSVNLWVPLPHLDAASRLGESLAGLMVRLLSSAPAAAQLLSETRWRCRDESDRRHWRRLTGGADVWGPGELKRDLATAQEAAAAAADAEAEAASDCDCDCRLCGTGDQLSGAGPTPHHRSLYRSLFLPPASP